MRLTNLYKTSEERKYVTIILFGLGLLDFLYTAYKNNKILSSDYVIIISIFNQFEELRKIKDFNIDCNFFLE